MIPKKIARVTKSTLRRRANQVTASLNSVTGRFKNPIWLIGEGRSGTTWLSSIVNHDKKKMEVFEPFHPEIGPISQVFSAHQYLRPGDKCLFETFSDRVFKGRHVSDRLELDSIGWRYDGLLIKDVFANLIAYWAFQRYPGLRIVLLIRNPFAVALSKSKKRDWLWMTNPAEFLGQENLMSDYLEPYRDVIAGIGDDYITRQVLIWSIVHYVPLQQFSRDQIYVQFYENIYENPETETENLFAFLYGPEGTRQAHAAMSTNSQLSFVSGTESMIAQGKSPVSGWLDEVSAQQKEAGYRILGEFGLGELYGSDGRPNQYGIDALIAP